MKPKHIWSRTTATSAVAYLFYAGTTSWLPQNALAQAAAESPTTTTTSPAAAPADAIDESMIDKFATAYTAVSAIQTQAAEELKTTTDPAKANEVKQNAESRAVQAVQSSGLKPEEFNRIATAMASDEQLRTRIASKLDKPRSGG